MSQILFKCRIEVPYHGIKKNGKQIRTNIATGKKFVGLSDRALFAEKWLIQKLHIERLKQRTEKINYYVNLKCTFYFPETKFYTKQKERSRKVPDLSNLYQMVEDCLQDVGILENDSLIESHDGSKREPIQGSKYYLDVVLSTI